MGQPGKAVRIMGMIFFKLTIVALVPYSVWGCEMVMRPPGCRRHDREKSKVFWRLFLLNPLSLKPRAHKTGTVTLVKMKTADFQNGPSTTYMKTLVSRLHIK